MSRWGGVGIVLAASIVVGGCATTPQPMSVSEPAEAAAPWPIELRTCTTTEHQPFPSEHRGSPVDELPEAITRVAPNYPQEARLKGVDGLVRFRALVCEHGRVVRAVVVGSIPLLDGAAGDALAQWSFRPARSAGRAVAAWTDVPLRFTLR